MNAISTRTDADARQLINSYLGLDSSIDTRIQTAHAVQRAAQQALADEVTRARAEGLTWKEIGGLLGIPRATASHRWGALTDPRP